MTSKRYTEERVVNDIETFAAYAERFEEVFASDDWSRVEPFFHEEATYQMVDGTVVSGREAVFAGMKASLDEFDRRFERRVFTLVDGPLEKGGVVWARWRAVYHHGDLPTLVIEGEESVSFRDGRIIALKDVELPAADTAYDSWVEKFGSQVGLSLEDA